MEVGGASVIDGGGTLAGTAFAVAGLCAMVAFAVRCIVGLPASLRELVLCFQGLDSLDHEYVDVDLAPFSHWLASATPAARVPQLKYRFRQRFSDFDQTGLAVWQASISFSVALLRAAAAPGAASGPDCGDAILKVPPIRGARVVELGAGLGVVSVLVAAVLGPAEVVATDGDGDAVAAGAENVLRNLGSSSPVSVQRLRWGEKDDIRAALHAGHQPSDVARKFDVVLGCDITYYPSPHALLLETIVQLTAARGTAIVAHRNRARSMDPPFFGRLAAHFARHERVLVPDDRRAGQGGGSITEESDLQVHVFTGFR